jgi:hypothetical protein
MSNEGGVTPFEAICEVALSGVTLVSGKGALGTRRFSVSRRIRTPSRKQCGLGQWTKAQVNQWCGAADEPAYAFHTSREVLC